MTTAPARAPAPPVRVLARTPNRLSNYRLSPAEVAEQQVICRGLKLAGMSLRRIAAHTGLALGTVHKRIRAQAAASDQRDTAP